MRFVLAILTFSVFFAVSSEEEGISIIRDAEIEETLTEMAKPIFKVAGLNPENAKVYVINSNSINAFTIGNGHIFLHSGLLLKFKNPLHIVGIMCHETAHIAAGHVERLMGVMKSRSTNLLAVMIATAIGMTLSGSPDAMAILLGYAISDERFFLKYSRDEEFAADALAASYMLKMDYSPEMLAEVFYEFDHLDIMNGGSNLPTYVRSHPSATARISAIKKFCTPSRGRSVDDKLTERYNRLTAKLKAYLKPIDCRSQIPTDPYIKAIYWHKIGRTAEALGIMQELLATNSNDIYYKEAMAQMLYESGKIAEAVKIYETICDGKTNPLIRIDYANALLELGKDIDKAIAILESVKYVDRLNENVFRLLAKAYGKKGREGVSQLMLANEQMLLKNYRKALELLKSCLTKMDKKTDELFIKKAKYLEELLERDYMEFIDQRYRSPMLTDTVRFINEI
ncbi:MAG: M48 family metalloprotease [Holosporaceae bacterium]|jgi:predicted Zn-dependent protease|nr:M48 family metalloprotease [Holosporaceae bacterium]